MRGAFSVVLPFLAGVVCTSLFYTHSREVRSRTPPLEVVSPCETAAGASPAPPQHRAIRSLAQPILKPLEKPCLLYTTEDTRNWKTVDGALTATSVGKVKLQRSDYPKPRYPNKAGHKLEIEVFRRPVRKLAVAMTDVEANGPNAWHRAAMQYEVWSTVRMAQREYGLDDAAVEVHLPQTPALREWRSQGVPLPPGWDASFSFVNVSDMSDWPEGPQSRPSKADADAVVVTTHKGFASLWQIGRIHKIGELCPDLWSQERALFPTFVEGFLKRGRAEVASMPAPKPAAMRPLVCYISRAKAKVSRRVTNEGAVVKVLERVFAESRVLELTQEYNDAALIAALGDCDVYFGVHGAGLMNLMYTKPSAATVELRPYKGDNYEYFGNVAALLGRRYEAVDDMTQRLDMKEYNISAEVLTRVGAALQRAADAAMQGAA
eukprot:TRINITY_DN30126_c0_g1_i1.p1 TRINITY_DN30126_c0_g1~~TRINITY_DN30126_c0_g1_i1.p1  ORF type:complete len:434 (+),score=78.57 TRINITY_DN30126_c0_g1_i1:52-1353(+)